MQNEIEKVVNGVVKDAINKNTSATRAATWDAANTKDGASNTMSGATWDLTWRATNKAIIESTQRNKEYIK